MSEMVEVFSKKKTANFLTPQHYTLASWGVKNSLLGGQPLPHMPTYGCVDDLVVKASASIAEGQKFQSCLIHSVIFIGHRARLHP